MAHVLTLGAAARLSGVSSKVLGKAIRDGRLPATRTDGWVYAIDADDLSRYMFAREIERLGSTPSPVPIRAPAGAPPQEERPTAVQRFFPLIRRLFAGRAEAA